MSRLPTILAPSLLSADFARLAEDVARVEDAGADWLHVDVMDGHFVPNITIGPPVVEGIHAVARVPLDVHLMIEEPARYAEEFARAGAHVLTFHREVTRTDREVRDTIRRFRDVGVQQVGMALNPDTPVEEAEAFLDELDLVLVMSVFPGFGGQKFMPEVLAKVEWLRARGYSGHVEMDGGLNDETLPLCAAAGANALVAGSAVFGADDVPGTVMRFRELADRARGEGAAREVS